jgi:ribonuclease P protein component
MRSSTEFELVTKRGRRARSGALVVYLITDQDIFSPDAKVGLIVGKLVGGSVIRHRIARRLRAQLSDCLPLLPPGAGVAVRALPDAALASSAELSTDLRRAFRRLGIGMDGLASPVDAGNVISAGPA